MKLYEINEELLRLDSELDSANEIYSEDRPVAAQIQNAFDSLQLRREVKIENLALLIKQADGFSELINDEISVLKERKAVHERKVGWLKNYLTFCMQDGEKFETGKVRIGWRKSESVEFDDESLIPKEFLREKITYEPNKTLIKETIKNGTPVPYCRVVEKKNIQIK